MPGQSGVPREAAMDMAPRYAREIVPSFNAYAYFRIATRLSRHLSQLLYRVRLGYPDAIALREVDPDASVVFVINHRSNMDYVLVTYVAADLVGAQLCGGRMGAGLAVARR